MTEPTYKPGSLKHHRYDSHERRRNHETSVEDPGLIALGVVTETDEATIDAAMRAFSTVPGATGEALAEIRDMLTGPVKVARTA